MNDAPHNHFAARMTRQWNADAVNRQANERMYGIPNSRGYGPSLFYISGWAGFGGLAGAALGAISSHNRGISSAEGALIGGAIGFFSMLVLSMALRFFFKGIGLGWSGIKMLISTLFGFAGLGSSSALGGITRSTIRGGLLGGLLGAALAIWLNEPVDNAALRVASIGAAAGAGWRVIRLAMGVLGRRS